MIIRAQMLMYGKEASNRKQEIDRQHHIIPNQKPKDKHYGKIKTFGFFHNADYGETPLTLSNKILKTLFCISFSAFEIFINLTNAKSTVHYSSG